MSGENVRAAERAELERIETREWLESLDYVAEHGGGRRVGQLFRQLLRRAAELGISIPFTANTPYVNTISRGQQPPFPGKREIERRIRSLVRWNAMAMVVPVICDVDKKNLIEIGRELSELSERARARKSRPEDLRGANLTVTNLGGLGTTYFSPLINWPEVAVVGIGRASGEAVYQDGAFAPRLILPLSVSYDHRIIDGADAARLLRWIADALEHPLALGG